MPVYGSLNIKEDKNKSKLRKKKLEVLIEKNDGVLWGRVEEKGNFMPTPYSDNYEEVVENLKELITDYQEHEGKDDRFWSEVDTNKLNL